jgi:formylglycine-generating enzyme required for sulfatase activity
MGSDRGDLIDLIDGHADEPFEDEHPEHDVYLDAFEIEQTEVSNAQYRTCVAAGACADPIAPDIIGSAAYYTEPAFDDFPVVNVTWQMASDYCAWRGRRLPTEAEWEKAARGPNDDRIYPWGWLDPTCDMANLSVLTAASDDDVGETVETCHEFPTPVEYYANSESPFGLLNVTGNAAEWVADYYAADYYDGQVWPDNADNPAGPPEGESRVVRGGGYLSSALFARVSFREHKPEDYYDVTIGFRCASGGEE